MNEASNTTNFKFVASGLFDDEPVEECHHKWKGSCAGIEHGECEAALRVEICSPWDRKELFQSGNKAALRLPGAWP